MAGTTDPTGLVSLAGLADLAGLVSLAGLAQDGEAGCDMVCEHT